MQPGKNRTKSYKHPRSVLESIAIAVTKTSPIKKGGKPEESSHAIYFTIEALKMLVNRWPPRNPVSLAIVTEVV